MKNAFGSRIQVVVLAVATAFALIMVAQSAQAQTSKVIHNSNQSLAPGSTAHSSLLAAYGKLPLAFEANRGQTDSRVKFLARGAGYTMFLTGDGAAFAFRQAAAGEQRADARAAIRNPITNPARRTPVGPTSRDTLESVVHMRLLGANPSAEASGLDELPGKSNYFIGNDPKKWRTDVPNYAKVKYQNVYPGIDLVYYGNHQQLEYDFVVAPGAQPSAIRLAIGAVANTGASVAAAGSSPAPTAVKAGASKTTRPAQLAIDSNGDLVVQVADSEIRFHKPVVYQPALSVTGDRSPKTSGPITKNLVNAKYVLKGNQVGFEIAKYDRTRSLIIDPAFTYSSLIGGTEGYFSTSGNAIAIDGAGNAYLTGLTGSDEFPIVNQIPGACNGECDPYYGLGFITKINAAGTALVYSSFFGGSGANDPDDGLSVAVDGSGSVYLTGIATSFDFPVVNQIPGACNGCLAPGTYATFIMKINAAGDALVYSSLVGGDGFDYGYFVTVDRGGNAYLTGATDSTNFPVVNQIPGACNGSCGRDKAYVMKVNAAGAALVYSSLLGGSDDDEASAVAVDSSGNVYVAGLTFSSDFPVVNQIPGACVGTCGQGGEHYVAAFATKINAAGSALIYSSLIGGSAGTAGTGSSANGLAIDSSGNVYLTGITASPDFPRVGQIPGACQGSCGTGATLDGFVTKINAAGNALAYSSVFGGSSDEDPAAIATDSSGNAYITGYTVSTDFPIVNQIPGGCPPGCNSGYSYSVFVTEVSADGSALPYSTLLGGNGSVQGDWGFSIATDSQANVYVTGWTDASNFPTVNQIPGACNGSCGHGSEVAFVVEISPASGGPTVNISPTSLVFPPQGMDIPNTPQVVTLTNTGTGGLLIASVAITGLNPSSFEQWNDCPMSPNTLAAGDNCAITVVFSPQQPGTLRAALTVTDNAPGSPENVPLTGTGVGGKPRIAGPQD